MTVQYSIGGRWYIGIKRDIIRKCPYCGAYAHRCNSDKEINTGVFITQCDIKGLPILSDDDCNYDRSGISYYLADRVNHEREGEE